MRLPAVSPAVATRLFQLALGALCLVVVTGAAVRLTDSGLGCSTWPTCHGHQLTPAWQYHSLVEFGNRMVAVLVTVATALAVVAAWLRSPRRRDLLVLAVGTFLGVLAQAVLGGLTVLFKLAPGWVMAHFLLSMVVVGVGVLLLAHDAQPEESGPERRRPAGPQGPPPGGARVARVGRETLLVSRAMVALTALVLGLGTVVTGAGPHAGSTGVGRLPISARAAAEMHSTLVMLLVGVTVATVLLLRPSAAPRDVEHNARWLLLAMVAQGGVGYTQYFTGVPAVLVEVHIIGAVLVWLAVLRFHTSLFTWVPASSSTVLEEEPDSAEPSILGESVMAPDVSTTAPAEIRQTDEQSAVRPDKPWLVIVWNDPINLMTYVTYVFQKLFGYDHAKATRLMLQVHHEGKAVVTSGTRERAELDVFRLHEHSLWATMEQSD